MNRTAIIDLGTNTFHILIADIGESAPFIVFQETIAVKLGEGGIREGRIHPEAYERGIAALKQFKSTIDHYQANLIKAVATSALRTASNGNEFLKKVRSETGIDPEIIDGEQEAEYIYQGVRAAINMADERSLILDIGGGSVEFIICNKEELFWKKSYDIGVARLIEQFFYSDPISETDIKKLNKYLKIVLSELKTQIEIHKPELLIGSAAAFETFAELVNPQFKVSFENPEFEIKLNDFAGVSELILKSTHEERSLIPAISPVRVDMIVMATLITKYILDQFAFKTLKLSTYSLKEGLLFEWIKNRQ